jgi:ribosomal protein S18 acetylase RimI-like enzyme
MTIRLAQPDDAEHIRACVYNAYARYVERIGRKPAPMLADFDSQIEQGIIYVAIDVQNNIQGFIVFYPKQDHMHLENVAVFSQYQGMGIGRQLISYCEKTAVQNGFSTIELYTNEKMTENLDIYPRLGYTEIGRWLEDGFNRVFYRKEL